ncbi:hypothetical protein [Poseidonibacter sp.]|uniref:hypothetical protein n=1 Tax=Poseidonibacter sp. TaxID=2321188 RepID=UPI003C77B54E
MDDIKKVNNKYKIKKIILYVQTIFVIFAWIFFKNIFPNLTEETYFVVNVFFIFALIQTLVFVGGIHLYQELNMYISKTYEKNSEYIKEELPIMRFLLKNDFF